MKTIIEKRYYSNGNIQAEIHYLNNKRHGLTKWYYNNDGTIQAEIPCLNGEKRGLAKWYHRTGSSSIEDEIPYLNGERHSVCINIKINETYN